ncbi:glycosyl hydrolase family 38, partial [candidate division KSB1 bacterium]|nr:glycosyl hydrolase family 38 [candidate division KSB1 bacterium]
MKLKKQSTLILLSGLFLILRLFSQEALTFNMESFTFPIEKSANNLLNGFQKSIQGQTMHYHSPLPGGSSALLVRALDGKMAIEWETEPVPSSFNDESVTFVWLSGTGCNLGEADFDLLINGNRYLTFRVINENEWRIQGKQKTELDFSTVMVDKHGDRFGLMSLKLPVTLVKTGEPLRLKVIGENAGKNIWFMTFQEALSEKISIIPRNGLQKTTAGNVQPVMMNLLYLGQSAPVSIQADGVSLVSSQLKTGFNNFRLQFPQVEREKNIHLTALINEKEVLNTHFSLKPIRNRTIYLVQHTHTDIGYTRPQTEILPEHLRYIDYALDYCDQTDDYPESAQFRWTCEASWAVAEYLKSRPAQQIARLKKRVAEGRIELTGMLFNMSEIPDENIYTDFLQPVRLFKEHGLPVTTAMQNDVNGAAWCLVDYFKDIGIEYLIMGQHGHRALAPFKVPTAFWWESPSGNRVLAFRADHYMTANMWGIHSPDFNALEQELFTYLQNLEEKKYPYDRIAVQYSGYLTDNSPPSIRPCQMIQKWNETYVWPQLKNATASEFMDYVKDEYANQLPQYQAAWPDWWTDGFGSAARETAAARQTQTDMIANQGLLAIARMAGAELPPETFSKIDAINEALLFYDEHTFGAAESISDPMNENSQVQWAEKAAYAWEAVKNCRMLRELGCGFLQAFLPQTDVPTITVINTLGWERSGLHELYIDHEILPRDKAFRIVDEQGRAIAAQLLSSRTEGSYWALWIDKVP